MATHAFDVVQSMELRTKAAVDAEKLFVHHRGKGQSAERFDAGFVDLLRVLVLAFELEGEVVCQMATLMIAS